MSDLKYKIQRFFLSDYGVVTLNGCVLFISFSNLTIGITDTVAVAYSTLNELSRGQFNKSEFMSLMKLRAETIEIDKIGNYIETKMKGFIGERAPQIENVLPMSVVTA